MDLLMSYHWPGNVRELENITERSMIVSQGDTLKVEGSWLAGGSSQNVTSHFEGSTHRSLAEIERQVILDALERTSGKVYGSNGAAASLGLKPTTLYGKMRKHKIRAKRMHESSQ